MSDINDFKIYAELVKRVKAGDESAFAELYERSKKLVYTTCYAILNNKQDAEDAMQETYISVYNGIKDLTEEMAFLPWIKRIAANRSLDKYRARKDTASYDDIQESEVEGDADLETLPESLILEKDKRETFMGIMRDVLTADQLQATILFYYDEMPVKDIADSMKCPENTIKTKLRLARVKIKNGIEAYEKSNKVSLMGGAVGTLSLGRFFEEYYKGLKIPTPKDLPFKAAGGKALKAAGKASVKAASGLSGKTMGIIGASVAGIGVIIGAIIGINAMLKKDDVVTEESTIIETSVMETTAVTSAATTETNPGVDDEAVKAAYLDVLAKYGNNILEFEKMGLFRDYSGSYGNNCSINYIDIDNNGVKELIFAYKTNYSGADSQDVFWNDYIHLAIYTYSEENDTAICLCDGCFTMYNYDPSGIYLTTDMYEVVLLDNGNLLGVRQTRYNSRQASLILTESEIESDSTNAVNRIRAKYSIDDSENTLTYMPDTAMFGFQEPPQKITDDEYLNMYEGYKSSVVMPIMAFKTPDCIGSQYSDFYESVQNNPEYYTFNDFVTLLGGDPVTIFEPQYDWKALYLDLINSFPIEGFEDGYISDLNDCIFYYDLVYINADETPELAVILSDSSGVYTCTVIYTIKNGEVVELYRRWLGPYFVYYPKLNRIEFISGSLEGVGYSIGNVVLFDCELSTVSAEYQIARSAVDLEIYPDYWSGESTIQDGVYYYYEADSIGNSEYGKGVVKITVPGEFVEVNPENAKTINEILDELSQ